MSAVEITSIVLSLVALAVTIIGFFASLKFYRDGVAMQGHADSILAKLEERAAAIHIQVGGMFDKTLNAALRLGTPQQAEREQTRILQSDESASTMASVAEVPRTGLPSDTDLARKVFQFYSYRRLQLTNVADPTAAFFFALGKPGGFNLFDGMPGIVFFGYFFDLDPPEIVARLRTLLTNLEVAYSRVEHVIQDEAARGHAKGLLDQVSVDALIPDSADKAALERKVSDFQPQNRAVQIRLYKPQEIEDHVRQELRSMEP